MKTIISFLLFGVVLAAQVVPMPPPVFPARVVGANAGFCEGCQPQINGGVWYAARIAQGEHPTYSYSLVNIDKVKINSLKPLNVQVVTSTETGVAQHLFKFSAFDVLATATGGLSTNSTNTGFSLGGGFVAFTSLGKGWMAGPYFRVAKATITPDITWKVGLTIAIGSN